MYLSYPPPSLLHTYTYSIDKTLRLLPIITTIIIQQNPLNNRRIQTRPAPLSPSEPGENGKEPDKGVDREGVLFVHISALRVLMLYIYIEVKFGGKGRNTHVEKLSRNGEIRGKSHKRA